MHVISMILATIVFIEHIYIMILEMYFSNTKRAADTFGIDYNFLQDKRVKTLFKNQGLYNGFLAAGLGYGLFFSKNQLEITTMFVIFVIIAAVYGAMTSGKGILIKQGLPAILAMIAILILK
ncbi:DUF1304 domain-containing protein [Macrococcus sp. EM39E]|uniref:DUF1304 domain-containing protein n=1 Tax=Macrococcus animalis TaxID=3395467 RepID=UPI0039BF8BD7